MPVYRPIAVDAQSTNIHSTFSTTHPHTNDHSDLGELEQFQRAETLAMLEEDADELLQGKDHRDEEEDAGDTEGSTIEDRSATNLAPSSLFAPADDGRRADGSRSGSGGGGGARGGGGGARGGGGGGARDGGGGGPSPLGVGARVQAWGLIGPPEVLRKHDVRPGLGTEISLDDFSASEPSAAALGDTDVSDGSRKAPSSSSSDGGDSGGRSASEPSVRPSSVVAEVRDDTGTVYCSDWYDGVIVSQRVGDKTDRTAPGVKGKEVLYDVIFDNVAVAPAITGGAGLPSLLVRPQDQDQRSGPFLPSMTRARTDSGDEYADATDTTTTPFETGGGGGGAGEGDGDGFHDCDTDGGVDENGGKSDGGDDDIRLPVLSIDSYNPNWPSMPVMSLDGEHTAFCSESSSLCYLRGYRP